ncbi:hypothetical protein LCI18_006268 [Fusarium solani-melongenae]|uniref:Uncharacterized protein n=1 Tax=Fusarium solani subsp. cucurbitae TaxID=2747967 RepID=A0ACD3Z239_FUSSC|nr:hypothetical protein LCI18_006268 [Fusarium solani-melongenae]
MDDSLPDLVRDWELDTKFVSDKQTIHTTYVSDPARGRWRRAEEEVWDQTSLLGRGSFGVVSLQKCTSGPHSGKVRAVKEIQVTLDQSLDKFLSREISAIVKFSHKRFRECFVPSFGWYRGQDSIFITMEYLPLGDLQSYLSKPLPDSEARTITEQTLQGIDFMHRSKIAHRDLKPKNILVQHKGPNWWVKISDFGCSKQSESTSLRTIIGTEPYLAPELQNIFAPSDKEDLEDEDDLDSPEATGYSLAVDMWALGAVTFRVVTGQVPFPSPVGRKLSRYVAYGGPFPSNELLRSECREFIVSVMRRSPRERPSAAKALTDPWIVCRCASEDVGPAHEPETATNLENDRETRTEIPRTAFKEASGTWSTGTQISPPQPNPVPDELKSTRIKSPDVNEASGEWSTVQQSHSLPPKLPSDMSQSPHPSYPEFLHANEASGKWSTIQQNLSLQPKPLPDESQRTESTHLTRPKSQDVNEASGSQYTIPQPRPLLPNSPSEGSETMKPTRLRVSDLGGASGSGSTAPRLPAELALLDLIQIRPLDWKKSSLTRIFPFKRTSAPKTRKPENYWKDKGFRGPPSECVFSANGEWLVSVGIYGNYGGEVFCVWKRSERGRFEQIAAYYSTSHSGRVKMALSSNGKRLVVAQNTDQTNSHQKYISTWEFGHGGVMRLVSGFWDSDERYADSWAISADTDRLFGATNTHKLSDPWTITISKPDPQGRLEILESKRFAMKVVDIACSADGNQFVAFHNNMCTVFRSEHIDGHEIYLWEPPRSAALEEGAKRWVSAFSPDGRWLIVSDDRAFKLFKGSQTRIWDFRREGIFESQAVVFSPNSKSFALGSLNGTVSIWRLDDSDSFFEHKTLRLPIESQLRSLMFSPCGQLLATTTKKEFGVWEMW